MCAVVVGVCVPPHNETPAAVEAIGISLCLKVLEIRCTQCAVVLIIGAEDGVLCSAERKVWLQDQRKSLNTYTCCIFTSVSLEMKEK